MHLLGIAGVGVHQHELADVVQQRGDQQPITVRIARGGREPVGRALDRDGVQPEALGRGIPGLAALEELEGSRARHECLHRLGCEHLHGGDDALDLTAPRGLGLVGQPQHGDHERDIGLDRLHEVARRRALLSDEREYAGARFGQRGKQLERLERRRQSFAMALVARGADLRMRCARPHAGGPARGGHLGSGQ